MDSDSTSSRLIAGYGAFQSLSWQSESVRTTGDCWQPRGLKDIKAGRPPFKESTLAHPSLSQTFKTFLQHKPPSITMRFFQIAPVLALAGSAYAELSSSQVVSNINAITELSGKTNNVAESMAITNFFSTAPVYALACSEWIAANTDLASHRQLPTDYHAGDQRHHRDDRWNAAEARSPGSSRVPRRI